MPSPYPWHYSIRWPFYFRWPSVKNHTGISPVARAHRFANVPREHCIRVVFGGDIMVMQGDRVPDISRPLQELLATADLVVCNCEAPVGEHPIDTGVRYRFNFHMPRHFLEGVINQVTPDPGNWILSVANNHAGDRGRHVFMEGIEIMQDIGVTPIGRWGSSGPPIKVIRCNGLRIGFVAWTNWLNCEVFAEDDPGVYRFGHIRSVEWASLKSALNVDSLIAFPHWEYEFQHYPRRQTREMAKELIQSGQFDMIVGSHSHTLQPMEWFGTGICQYSLGNFCGLGVAWPVKLISILEVFLGTTGANRGKVVGYELHPFVQLHSQDRVTLIPLEQAPDVIQARVRQRLLMLFGEPNSGSR